jgi:hypothetical protein
VKPAASPTGLWVGAVLLAAIAVFFLWGEHRVHLLGALPWLLLLACPLIHLFMHRGHGHGHDHGGHGRNETTPPDDHPTAGGRS